MDKRGKTFYANAPTLVINRSPREDYINKAVSRMIYEYLYTATVTTNLLSQLTSCHNYFQSL